MTDDAREITALLGGKWHGTWGHCRCPAHVDANPSLSVSNGKDGRLLLRCFAGCSFADVRNELIIQGIIDGYADRSALTEEAVAEAERREQQAKARVFHRISRLWDSVLPVLRGTPADIYLRSRGLILRPLPCIRFHPAVWHPGGGNHPAMISKVMRADGEPVQCLHRTFVRPDGSGKGDLSPSKALLGSPSGGGVLVTEPLIGGPLVVAEGIENAIAFAQLNPKVGPVWAALSASGMARFVLPEPTEEHRELVIAADGDEVGLDAANDLAVLAEDEGWHVQVVAPPEGFDWNNLLLALGERK